VRIDPFKIGFFKVALNPEAIGINASSTIALIKSKLALAASTAL